MSLLRTTGGPIWLALILCGALAGPTAEPFAPDAATIRALGLNGRVLVQSLEYLALRPTATGFSVEPCHLFRDGGGRRLMIRREGIAGRKFIPHRNYVLRLRYVGYTDAGLPLAEVDSSDQSGEVSEKYEDDIRESDLRVEQLKQNLLKGDAPPASIRLRYSGTRDDYLVFYDLLGRRIFYRYREDRFDDRGKKKIRNLVRGMAYAVRGDYQGVSLAGRLYSPQTAEYRDILARRDSVPTFLYRDIEPLRLEQILFR